MTFKRQMAGLKGITVPDVYMDLSSQEVLTTAWVDGALQIAAPQLWLDNKRSSACLRIFTCIPGVNDGMCACWYAPGRLTVSGLAATGEKLSESNAADVRELCNTLLNCYLIQLLETGTLHADP